MSEPVKMAIAGKSFANGDLDEVLKLADAIEKTVKIQGQVSAVETTVSGTAQEGDTAVWVLTRGGSARGGSSRGRSQRGGYRGRGHGRGRGQGQQKGQETVPDGSCPQHRRYGREAFYCMDVSSCPMKDIVKKREWKSDQISANSVDIIDIITHEKDTRIYTDYNFLKEFSESTDFEPHIDGGQEYKWGIHSFKPVVQKCWDKSIAQAASLAEQCQPYIFEINGAKSKVDFRPRLFDGTQWALLDTGAMVSVYPKDQYKDATLNTHMTLEAVNKSQLQTFGTRTKQIKIGRKTYSQDVILADVSTPILGFDFIKKHRLSFDWNRWGDFVLYDKRARISTVLKIDHVP